MSLTDEASSLDRERELREKVADLLRKLDRAEASKEQLVDAVYRAALDASAALVIPPVPAPPKDKRKAKSEVAICLLADWQSGKVTPEYDSAIAAKRIVRYGEKVVSLIELQRAHHPVDEARIYLLGDLLEGEMIFPGQAHRIDASLYVQLFDTASVLANLVRLIAANVQRVKVIGVIGNHGALGGRARREYHPETNADAMLYNVARMQLRDEPRVEWVETLTAGERSWFAVDDVIGKRWFLFHGDQVKSASFGIPWYGFGKRLLGWATSVAPFDYSASGHWHQAVSFPINAITHWGAGSTESGNTYAQEHLASGGQRPTQWLLFQSDNGVTAEYRVYVDEVAA